MACVLSLVVTGQMKESVVGAEATPSPLSLVTHESNGKFSSQKPPLRVVPTMACECRYICLLSQLSCPMNAEESCRLGTGSCGGLRPYAQSGALSGSLCRVAQCSLSPVPASQAAGDSLVVRLAQWLP